MSEQCACHLLALTIDRERGAHLTARQVTMVAAVAQGLTTAQIARRLQVTEATVEHHLGIAMLRAGARSRSELVARCYVAGVLSCGIWPPAASGRLCLAFSA